MQLTRPTFHYNKYQERYNGVNLQTELWTDTLEKYLWQLLESPPITFYDLKSTDIPKARGVYLITDHRNKPMHNVIYVGKSKNLRKRIYIHIMGRESNSPMHRYLISDKIEENVTDRLSAIDFILDNLSVRWLICNEDWEDPIKLTGYIESYLIAKLKPLYGISLKE